ncbi:MAG: 50S ribosomal protein L23 [bacterium]|nr:50S ribosomal protein L23 [bacterium]
MAIEKVPSSVHNLRYSIHDVLIRPLITEKSMDQHADNKYTFLVALKANKFDIRNAVESLFKVSVLKVTTVRMMGKRKRRGRIYGKRPDYKKAYVTIKAGDKIEIAGAPLFEN